MQVFFSPSKRKHDGQFERSARKEPAVTWDASLSNYMVRFELLCALFPTPVRSRAAACRALILAVLIW